MKRWLSEAQIEGWFPLSAEEQLSFDANGLTRSRAPYRSATRQNRVLVGDLLDQHVSEQHLATRDPSPSCSPDAGCQDHGVRRNGGVCLDIHTHRSHSKPATDFADETARKT